MKKEKQTSIYIIIFYPCNLHLQVLFWAFDQSYAPIERNKSEYVNFDRNNLNLVKRR